MTTTETRDAIECSVQWEDDPRPPYAAEAVCRTLLGPLGSISRGRSFRAGICGHLLGSPDLSLMVTIPRPDWRDGESDCTVSIAGQTVGMAERLREPLPVDLRLAPAGGGEADPGGWSLPEARSALRALVYDDGWVGLLHKSTVRALRERAASEAAAITAGAIRGRGGWQ